MVDRDADRHVHLARLLVQWKHLGIIDKELLSIFINIIIFNALETSGTRPRKQAWDSRALGSVFSFSSEFSASAVEPHKEDEDAHTQVPWGSISIPRIMLQHITGKSLFSDLCGYKASVQDFDSWMWTLWIRKGGAKLLENMSSSSLALKKP